ncbi:MAG: hypothetical protein JO307_22365 [Bryobacterales bacterium]|nr:hypothetical protein [Bryobacterales bacterium]MBV9399844.1 hypothetical protein [Bryobacterales bacterium]
MRIWSDLHEAYGIALHIEEIAVDRDSAAALYTERGCFASLSAELKRN